MKACYYVTFGAPDVLQFGDFEEPYPAKGQVLVRLAAASVTPLDCKMRAGLLSSYFGITFPKIPGRDGVGAVVACGEGVSDFKVGDRVCVMVLPADQKGTYAEMIACDEQMVHRLPPGLGMVEAVALVNSGMSAWIAAVDTANVQRGQKVLIHGGSGSVGGLLIQLCRHLGAQVTTTCGSANKDYVLSLGADQAIAYDCDDVIEIEPQDVVFDLIGGQVHDQSYQLLRRGGHLVWLVASPISDRSTEFGVRVTRAIIRDDKAVLDAIFDLAEKRAIRPQVAATMPLTSAQEAHWLVQSGKISRGRVVLEM